MSDSFGASALKSTGPSIALDKTAGGVGTFKGVMLCNRPFGGTEGASQKGSNTAVQSFRAGKVPDPVGASNLAIQNKVKRPKKENALTRHRKWLVELQKTKDRLEEEYTIDQIKEDEKKMQFQERERQMRLAARAMMKEAKSITSEMSEDKGPETNDSPISYNNSPNVAESKESSSSKDYTELAAAKAASSSRPAWAYAKEEDADLMLEEKELDDDEGLLEFASGLDFNKYIDDVEVKTMMAAVAKRISELEKDVKNDDERTKEAIQRQALREQIAMSEARGDKSSMDTNLDSTTNSNDEALNFAKAVLADMDELGQVHSTASVAQLYKQAQNTDSRDESAEPKEISMGEASIGDPLGHKGTPLIAVHQDDEGARLNEKKAIHKLPYMNRNPAV